MEPKNILVTGPPGSGKSTLIEKVLKEIRAPVTGFFTRELREKGRRVGFSITTLDGKGGVLGHEKIKKSPRVGKYGVDLQDLERIAVPSIVPSQSDQVVIIDEIGKMECLSSLFRETITKALDCPNPVIATVALHGGPFIDKIKSREDVLLIVLSEGNRDSLVTFLAQKIDSANRKA